MCRDTIAGRYVLIENQLERTDHMHLRRLLTYAAGLEAVTIIWVASRFTEEHRAALDWLNSATRSFDFFGLEVELWWIGDSAMALKFNVVSKPNDWSDSVREQAAAAHSGQFSETQQKHLDFRTQFREHLVQRGSSIRSGKPSKDPWTNVSVGRTHFALQAWNSMRDGESGVQLQIHGPDAKAHYGLIEQRHREFVNGRLSRLGILEWRLLPEGKESQIRVWRQSTPADRVTWPDLNVWMATTLETLHGLFRPIVKTLDASDWHDPESQAGEQASPVMPLGPVG